MFELPSREDVTGVVITGECVREGSEPHLVHASDEQQRRSA